MEKKIFIIDDNQAICLALSTKIRNAIPMAEVFEFSSVEKALGLISKNPDIIILDHFLEKTDGIDCIPIFKELSPKSKIIVFSSQDSIETFQQAMIYGANDYFRKDKIGFDSVLYAINNFFIESKSHESWFSSFFKNKKNSNKLIYVLEDNPNMAFSIQYFLSTDKENKVFTFSNSQEFFAEIKKAKPGVVVLDFNLEEKINGLDVLKTMNKDCPQTHVIILSSQKDVKIAAELLRSGARHYLIKSKENVARLKDLIANL